MDTKWESYAQYILNEASLDADALVPYFKSILEDSHAESLELMSQFVDQDLASTLIKAFEFPDTIPIFSSQNVINPLNASVSSNDITDSGMEINTNASNLNGENIDEEIRTKNDIVELVSPGDNMGISNVSVDESNTKESIDNFMLYINLVLLISQKEYPYFFSVEAINCANARSGGDTEKAYDILVRCHQELQSLRPCINFINNCCYLLSCKFEHDLKNYTCKCWLSIGGCKNSDANCQFAHDIIYEDAADEGDQMNDHEAPDKAIVVKEEDFPDLLGRIPKTPLPKEVPSTRTIPKVVNGPAPKVRVVLPCMIPKPTHSKEDIVTTFSRNEWVDSGKVLSHDYCEVRLAAQQATKARNRLLELSRTAFLSCDGQNAKLYSKQADELNATVIELNKKAAKTIFQNRNPAQSLASGIIDLHGLHAEEAIEVLDSLIPSYQGRQSPVRIVTGSGHHSSYGGMSVLYTTVQNWCKQHSMSHRAIVDTNGYKGGFSVSL